MMPAFCSQIALKSSDYGNIISVLETSLWSFTFSGWQYDPYDLEFRLVSMHATQQTSYFTIIFLQMFGPMMWYVSKQRTYPHPLWLRITLPPLMKCWRTWRRISSWYCQLMLSLFMSRRTWKENLGLTRFVFSFHMRFKQLTSPQACLASPSTLDLDGSRDSGHHWCGCCKTGWKSFEAAEYYLILGKRFFCHSIADTVLMSSSVCNIMHLWCLLVIPDFPAQNSISTMRLSDW